MGDELLTCMLRSMNAEGCKSFDEGLAASMSEAQKLNIFESKQHAQKVILELWKLLVVWCSRQEQMN